VTLPIPPSGCVIKRPQYRARISKEQIFAREAILDLLDFATRQMAEFCTGSVQIAWSEVIQLRPFGTPPNHVPDDILGNSLSPRRSVTANGPEDSACADLGRGHPAIDRLYDPVGHGHGPNMAALCQPAPRSPKLVVSPGMRGTQTVQDGGFRMI
jgi:hypothetical protein